MKPLFTLSLALSLGIAALPANAEAPKAFSQKISFSASGMDLKDALRMVVKKGGLNAVIDESIKGSVNVDLQNVPLGKAIETLSLLGGLHCYERENVLVFVSREDALKRGLIRLNSQTFRIQHASAAKIAEVVNNTVFGNSQNQGGQGLSSGNSGVGGTNGQNQFANADLRSNTLVVVGSPQELGRAAQIVQELDVKLERKVFKLNYANAVQIASILNGSVFNYGPISQQGTGGTSGGQGMTTGGNEQVIAEVENLKDSGLSAAGSSAQLGQNTSSIRTTTVTTQKVDIPYRGPIVVPDTRSNSVIVVGTAEQLAQAQGLVSQLDRRLPQVAIDVEVIELTERGSQELGTSFSGQTGQTQYSFSGSGLSPSASVSNSSTFPVSNNFRVSLNALVNKKLAKLLASPRITATDNTESQLEIVDEVIKGTRISNQNLTIGNQTMVVVEPIFGIAGIILNILPRVSEDGFVSLRLHPTVSNIRETMKDSQNNLITLLSRRDLLTQQVRVRNGETLALGGITQENVIKNRNQVPILGSIPLLGNLFAWDYSEKTKTELLILMTPRVLTENEAPPKKPF